MLQVLPLSMEPRLTTAADGEQRRTTIGRLRLPLLETAVGRPLTHTTYPAPRPLLTLPLGTSPSDRLHDGPLEYGPLESPTDTSFGLFT